VPEGDEQVPHGVLGGGQVHRPVGPEDPQPPAVDIADLGNIGDLRQLGTGSEVGQRLPVLSKGAYN